MSAPRSVAEAIGQIVWLLSQSPTHRELRIGDLEWSFMPAVVLEQFRIFRFGTLPDMEDVPMPQVAGFDKQTMEQLPLGVAIWAKVSAAVEAKLEKGERLAPEEWRSGDRVWLLELIAPFATPENKLRDAMLLDLTQGPFRDCPFSLHRTDLATRKREAVRISTHLRQPQAPA
jgi:cytolysin-activating lysine-acyltransferase